MMVKRCGNCSHLEGDPRARERGRLARLSAGGVSSLACAPEARAPMNLNGARVSRLREASPGSAGVSRALRRRVAGAGDRGAGVTARHYVIMRPNRGAGVTARHFYHWTGLDSPLMYAAHKAAGGITSVYRQVGIGCQRIFHQMLQDYLGLSAEEATWSYVVGSRKLSLDGRIETDNVKKLEVKERIRE